MVVNDTVGYIDVDGSGSKGNTFGIQQIIFKQLDRIGYLQSIGTVNCDCASEARRNASALWKSAYYLESLLDKFHTEEYKLNAPSKKEESKELINKVTGFNTEFDEAWNTWFALLVNEMSVVGLLPVPDVEYHFQKNDGVWDKKRGIDYGHIYEDQFEDFSKDTGV